MVNMSSQIKNTIIVVLGFTLLGVMSCGEKAPPQSPPKVVKQKISASSPPSDNKAAAPMTASAPKKPVADAQGDQQQTNAASTTVVATDATATPDLIKETLQIASTYDPTGRFDPFEPLFREKPKVEVEKGSGEKRQRRIPQTPLEKVALGQLKLTAVIRAPSGNRGLVVDATGKGYVVEKGTYIGLNSGQVLQVENDRIIVEENIEGLVGELTVQKSELKLQKPAGEL